MIKSRNRFCIIPFVLSFPITSYGQVYLGGSVGASFVDLGNNRPEISYFSGALITDDYPLTNNNKAAFLYSINIGYELPKICEQLSLAFGLGWYANPSNEHFQGQVVETPAGDPGSTLYNYKFETLSRRLMLEMQVSWLQAPFLPLFGGMSNLSPFIQVGIGPSWNRMHGYHEMAFDNTSYPPLAPFQSRTKTEFAYQVGFGLSKGFHQDRDRISIGYRYANLGNTAFGSRGASYPYALHTGTLQNNEVYLGFTHLF
jgi:opacity protein-like surface antigen